MRTRRELRRMAAPILSRFTRMVAAVARASPALAGDCPARGWAGPQALHQRVRKCGEHQAQPVGEKLLAAGPGSEQVQLCFLDPVLGLATLAIQAVV